MFLWVEIATVILSMFLPNISSFMIDGNLQHRCTHFASVSWDPPITLHGSGGWHTRKQSRPQRGIDRRPEVALTEPNNGRTPMPGILAGTVM
jgi:hypothetical protein